MYRSISDRVTDIEVLNLKSLVFTLINITSLVCDNILTQTVSVINFTKPLIFSLGQQLYSI